jgi:hypothetical protein
VCDLTIQKLYAHVWQHVGPSVRLIRSLFELRRRPGILDVEKVEHVHEVSPLALSGARMGPIRKGNPCA